MSADVIRTKKEAARMSSTIDGLTETYPDKRYVYSTSKGEALRLLRELTERVQAMDEDQRTVVRNLDVG